MNSNEALMIVLAAVLIAAAIVVGFAAFDTTPAQVIHPVGPMDGMYGQLHPLGHEIPGVWVIPADEIIYVPAYPDEPCSPEDRILLDTPIRIEDETGTVRWHWIYENKTIARNRT